MKHAAKGGYIIKPLEQHETYPLVIYFRDFKGSFSGLKFH